MIISFIYYVTLSKFIDSSFPQCNVHTGVQGGCLAFTPLDGYLKLWELSMLYVSMPQTIQNFIKRARGFVLVMWYPQPCV